MAEVKLGRARVFKGKGKLVRYYWHIKGTNGKVTSCGGQGFVSKDAAWRSYSRDCEIRMGLMDEDGYLWGEE